jgi:hypothetical protein
MATKAHDYRCWSWLVFFGASVNNNVGVFVIVEKPVNLIHYVIMCAILFIVDAMANSWNRHLMFYLYLMFTLFAFEVNY